MIPLTIYYGWRIRILRAYKNVLRQALVARTIRLGSDLQYCRTQFVEAEPSPSRGAGQRRRPPVLDTWFDYLLPSRVDAGGLATVRGDRAVGQGGVGRVPTG